MKSLSALTVFLPNLVYASCAVNALSNYGPVLMSVGWLLAAGVSLFPIVRTIALFLAALLLGGLIWWKALAITALVMAVYHGLSVFTKGLVEQPAQTSRHPRPTK